MKRIVAVAAIAAALVCATAQPSQAFAPLLGVLLQSVLPQMLQFGFNKMDSAISSSSTSSSSTQSNWNYCPKHQGDYLGTDGQCHPADQPQQSTGYLNIPTRYGPMNCSQQPSANSTFTCTDSESRTAELTIDQIKGLIAQ